MKIVHIATRKEHPCFSSTVFFQSERHDVAFVVLEPCANPLYAITSRYREDGVEYMHVSVCEDFDSSPDSRLELLFFELFKTLNPNIIHIQFFCGVNALSILRASSGKLAKIILTLHTHALFCTRGDCFDDGEVCALDSWEKCACQNCHNASRRNGLSLLQYNRVRKARCWEIVSKSDVIICCSHWQEQTLRRFVGNKSKTVVLYYGVQIPSRYKSCITKQEVESVDVDWQKFRQIIFHYGWGEQISAETIRLLDKGGEQQNYAKKVLGDDFQKILSVLDIGFDDIEKKSFYPCFGYLGTLWEQKGIDVLLDAAQQIDRCDFKILMAVNCDSTREYDARQLDRLKNNPKIEIITNLNRGDFYEKFFSQIDYLVVPSLWEETGPMTLFEAFFFKTPVIISNHLSMVEKVREGINALVFDNAEALAGIMKGLIERRIMIEAKTQKDFPVATAREYAQKVEGIYAPADRSKRKNSFVLHIGSLCNNNCIFCVRGGNNLRKTVDFELLKDMLRDHRVQNNRVVITGGEPMIQKDFLPVIREAGRLGYRIVLETNGRMLADAKLARTLAAFDLQFMIHLDGCNALGHERITRRQGSFFETIAGIRNASKYSPDVHIKVIIVKQNYRDLLKMSKLVGRLGVSGIQIVFPTPEGHVDKLFKLITSCYSDVRPYVSEAVNWIMQNIKMSIVLENFPFCVIDPEFRGFESQRIHKENGMMVGLSPRINEEKIYQCLPERLKNKTKSKECRLCKFFSVCEGVYQRYITTFGWQEFHPVIPEKNFCFSKKRCSENS